MRLWGGCFEVTGLSVAAFLVAACHACKNVCEVKNLENCGPVPKEASLCLMTEQQMSLSGSHEYQPSVKLLGSRELR